MRADERSGEPLGESNDNNQMKHRLQFFRKTFKIKRFGDLLIGSHGSEQTRMKYLLCTGSSTCTVPSSESHNDPVRSAQSQILFTVGETEDSKGV